MEKSIHIGVSWFGKLLKEIDHYIIINVKFSK